MQIGRRIIKDNLQTLLGLTKNEAKVYEALLETSKFDTQKLSEITGLPRTRIYEVLSKLAAKNLLEKLDRGSGYRLIPPNESINEYLTNLEMNFRSRKESIRELSSHLHSKFTKSLASDISPGVTVLPFRDAESFLLNQLSKVQNRLFISISAGSQSIDWKKSGNRLATGYHKKLDIRYLMPSLELAKRVKFLFSTNQSYKHLNIKLKYNPNVYTSFIIIDNVIYLFFLGQTDETSLETLVLRTGSESLLKSYEWMHEQLWDSGTRVNND